MTTLLAAEALKLRTLRLPWAVLILGLALSGVIGAATTRIAIDAHDALAAPALAVAPAQTLWLLAVIVAVLASSGEFHHRTIHPTLLGCPHRGRVLLAKTVVAATYAAALLTIGAATAVATGTATAAVSRASVSWGGSWLHLPGAVLSGAILAILAAGLGTLTRNTATALVAVLLWRFLGEGILPMLLRKDWISRWTPNGTAEALIGLGAHPLPAITAGPLLAGYATVACALATAQFLIRDP